MTRITLSACVVLCDFPHPPKNVRVSKRVSEAEINQSFDEV